MKSGFVAVVGRPNVGKSTLVNRMVGEKVSIVSTRPQTTRSTIRGVVTAPGPDPGHQIVLVDTPGLHKPKTELGERLNSMVYGTLGESDAAVLVIDAGAPVGPGDRRVARRVEESGVYAVVAVNKVDQVGRAQVASQLLEAAEWPFPHVFPVSATTGDGVDALVAELVEAIPEGPMYFPPGMITDQPEAALVAELIREKFLDRLRQELPHSVLVRVEEIDERDDGSLDVTADVLVERDSQKGIVIGKGGALLRDAGTEAREEVESLLGTRVHLALQVKVERDWQRRPQMLDRLGFGT